MIEIHFYLGYWEAYVNDTFFDSAKSLEVLLKRLGQKSKELKNAIEK